jgi:hypothetical protein
MKTTNNASHEQNVVNLEVLKTVVSTFGILYNPPKASLTIPALGDLLDKGKLEINAINIAEVASKNAIAARTTVFEDFDSLITRTINGLQIAGVSAQTLTQAKAVVRDLRGKRVSKILSEEELAASKENGNEVKQAVVHNASMVSKIENLAKFILFLETIAEYHPNEADLTVGSLRAKLEEIKMININAVTAEASLNAARLSRDTLLYTDNTGLVDVAQQVKLYTKSVFGADSAQYKQVSNIKFIKR